ncbi:MAG TPA: aminotransferase class IV [Gaiellaceae bacterium]|jgi:branched-subunit amino acid aminotransferase/4-amino-4-deoxychorismate lyase
MTLLAVAIAGRGLVDPAEPVFRADDDALLRGGAAFETIRVYGGQPFLLADHLTRFRFSAEALALPEPIGVEELVAAVLGAAPADHVLRLYRTTHAVVATAAAVPAGLDEARAHGVALKTFDVGQPTSLLAGAKTTSYDVSLAARREAERAGADDALLVGAGRVLEGATANIWWRRGEELYTPAVRPGVLPGVTRAFVLSVETAREGEFDVADLLDADEAFLTSSIREVMPVVAVDGKPIGDGRPGPAATRLQDALRLRSAA